MVKGICRKCVNDRKKNGFFSTSESEGAAFSRRMVSDTTQEIIGGGDMYHASCRKHHSSS